MKTGFATTWGFYFAAVGSALGLGNLWRFPYIVGENGGGAFLILYVLATFAIGLPLLCAELALGKSSRKGPVGALSGLSQNPSKLFQWFGRLSVIASLLLLSYFAVVCGWVLHFCVEYLIGLFVSGPVLGGEIFARLMMDGWLQLALATLHVMLSGWIIAKGVQSGMERAIGMILPLFLAFLVYLTYESLQLPGATEAMRFLFYPNFRELSLGSAIEAVGQVLFTLSLGFGVMIVFGSYMKPETGVPEAAVKVVTLDLVLSLGIGLLIFPIVFSGGLRPDTGPTILFETVPMLLAKVGLNDLFGFLFFLCAYLAGLGATLGLMEVGVATWTERRGSDRIKATWIVSAIALVIAFVPAFASNIFRRVQVSGKNLLEVLDAGLIHWLLPVIAVGFSLAMGYRMGIKVLRDQFVWDERRTTMNLFQNWVASLRWLIPILITLALSLEFFGFVRSLLQSAP